MGYYMAGDYYMAGGIFGSIGKFLGGAVKTVGGVAAGAIGSVISGGNPLAGAIKGGLTGAGIISAPSPTPVLKIPTMPATPASMVPQVTAPGYTVNKQGLVVKKRRRMNAANPRALRRAMRREEAFVKMARRALKGSKYTVATRGARRSHRDVIVPKHVEVR